MPTEVDEGKSTRVPVSTPLALETPAPPLPPDESVTHRCANCLTPLSGPFCAQCGQHVADYHRSVWRFVADFFDNAFCWDNKLFRTLDPLIKRPGFLTQEFMAGRRVRYVHPLRLFLFTSAICLTLIQYTHHTGNARGRGNRASNGKPGATVKLDAPDDDKDDDEKDAAASPAPKASPATSLAAGSPAPAPSASPTPAEPSLGQVFRDTYGAGRRNGKPMDAKTTGKLGQNWEAIGENLQKQIEAGKKAGAFRETMADNIQQKLSWVTLAMLPIFALLMRWAYGRNGGYYFTYLVFSLHYHTFLLLFWVSYSLLDALTITVNAALFELPGLIVGLCLLIPPYYLYRALRRMYGQSRKATVAKVFAIGALHLLALFIGLAIIHATSFL